jgi:uncharacterized protein YkwD
MTHRLEVRIKKPQLSRVYFPWRVVCTVLMIGLLVIFGMSGSDQPASADSPTPNPNNERPCYPAGYAYPDGTTEIVCLGAPEEVGPAMVDFSPFEQQVLELVNQARWDNGQLPPLKGNQALTDAARYHSADMRDDDYFDHDSYNRVGGSLVFERSCSDRVRSYYDAGYIGENIAAGQSTPSHVMNVWMNSSGHRANILRDTFREIGIGYASGGYYGHYWTQDFGTMSDVYPVVINREAYSTTTSIVSLYVYGCDWATQMRFSNDGTNWSDWETCNPDKSWTLAGVGGLNTVYCQITDGSTAYTNSDDVYIGESWQVHLPLIQKNIQQ